MTSSFGLGLRTEHYNDFLEKPQPVEWKKRIPMIVGLALFCLLYFSPSLPAAVDPAGERFELSHEGKAAVGLFLLAATWWVFEVVPIGVTSLAIGVLQAMFLIRPARVAFSDFLVPSVWFIFASLIIGTVFTNTGLTKRIAYKMLGVVGERTSMILLGVFVLQHGQALIQFFATEREPFSRLEIRQSRQTRNESVVLRPRH